MLIRKIQERAEEAFLEALEATYQHSTESRGVLICRFPAIQVPMDADTLLASVRDVLKDKDGELYCCRNGDMALVWKGKVSSMMALLKKAVIVTLPENKKKVDDERFFRFFDSHADAENLRAFFVNKLPAQAQSKVIAVTESSEATPPPPAPAPPAHFADWQLESMVRAMRVRKGRKLPEILVVEDQDFSRKLLLSMLEKNYVCHSARNGTHAIDLYALHAPDIVFLDIELPDISGHELSGLLKKSDPNRFIVMVTANHYAKDVETAKQNAVQGFIAKPYNKQKIQNAIDAYLAIHKK